MTGAIASGIAAAAVATRLGRSPLALGILTAATAFGPLHGLLVGSVMLGVAAGRRFLAARRAPRAIDDDLVLLTDLTALGLASGLPLAPALDKAAGEVGGIVGAEVQDALRAAGRVGLAAALLGATGSTGRLLRLAARAVATGAPLAGAVTAYAAEVRHAAHAARLAAARRLPVRLLVPLALLVLPGFVVLAVGPVLLESLARLAPVP